MLCKQLFSAIPGHKLCPDCKTSKHRSHAVFSLLLTGAFFSKHLSLHWVACWISHMASAWTELPAEEALQHHVPVVDAVDLWPQWPMQRKAQLPPTPVLLRQLQWLKSTAERCLSPGFISKMIWIGVSKQLSSHLCAQVFSHYLVLIFRDGL